jgi:hypothetical protein
MLYRQRHRRRPVSGIHPDPTSNQDHLLTPHFSQISAQLRHAMGMSRSAACQTQLN